MSETNRNRFEKTPHSNGEPEEELGKEKEFVAGPPEEAFRLAEESSEGEKEFIAGPPDEALDLVKDKQESTPEKEPAQEKTGEKFDYERAREEIKERLRKLEKRIIEFKKVEEELYKELGIRDHYDKEDFRRERAYERGESGKTELSAEEVALSSLGRKRLDISYEIHNIYNELKKMEGKLTKEDLSKMEERLQALQLAKDFGI